MTISSMAAAKRVCERSGWNITNLKLQKILYMAHLAYMGEHNGQHLIDGRFEAWDYGPVEPCVYRRVSLFGRSSIQDIFGYVEDIEGTPEAAALDEYVDALLAYSPSELVSMTHWENGAWAKHYVPGVRGIEIPQDDILEEYRARVHADT
ncbi:DUF4065 domain-containing protein [Gluconobacter sp. Dm-74]|uniref:Panacea domain-containing protein n=1 Tax=Gluconobacter sp. Dm-74 TaxID=2799803 RepID=UPI001B8D6670|nr:type II toxin-antitoxin system antitoxin SocA domain-containing protein [Gluconobacter sp. Dm-74]MBS1091493.1 DUF4065 domain-containing protein [Gluconobacter sp. Dm-74]